MMRTEEPWWLAMDEEREREERKKYEGEQQQWEEEERKKYEGEQLELPFGDPP